jgi:2-polyprenyl-6-hydroxyphenyl methylase/3-demethylubiquinone-9 3-methyltransferase
MTTYNPDFGRGKSKKVDYYSFFRTAQETFGIMTLSASIDSEEIARFAAHTQDWWNPDGVWSPLHRINPARIKYIESMFFAHFSGSRPLCGTPASQAPRNRDCDQLPFLGRSVLDVGCGGGLLCEPLARRGAKVTGLDVSVQAIATARAHAAAEKLKIAYLNGSVENLARGGKKFDAILAMEILEHVADADSLLQSAASLLKPGGIILFSTINRTMKSFLLGIVAAEYVLGWVPPGMHDWEKFVRPSELAAHLKKAGLTLSDLTGMVFNPLSGNFDLKPGKVGVNYLAAAVKSDVSGCVSN